MGINKTKYKREFYPEVMETRDLLFRRTIILLEGDEACDIQRQIRKKFQIGEAFWENVGGYDGKQFYNYKFSDNIPEIEKGEEKKFREMVRGQKLHCYSPQRYESYCSVKKAGAEEDLKNPCDLEKFLLENGFTKVD